VLFTRQFADFAGLKYYREATECVKEDVKTFKQEVAEEAEEMQEFILPSLFSAISAASCSNAFLSVFSFVLFVPSRLFLC
jgi:hypothetical protein